MHAMKTCTSCGSSKAPSEFGKRLASADGLSASCSSCLRDRDRARYQKEKTKRAERHKRYANGVGKAACTAAKERWLDKNKIKRAAHVIVGNAIKYGQLTKAPCVVCGGKAQAHHENYSKPLEVVWLCPEHHKERHKQMAIQGIEP